MKTIVTVLSLVILMALLFSSTSVFAEPNENKNVIQTPGARATERANEKATQGIGKIKGKPVNIKGPIAYVEAGSISLKLNDGSTWDANLTDRTKIKIPKFKNATWEDLKVGMIATVHAREDNNGDTIAVMVMVIPKKPSLIHRVGFVTDYDGESITITSKNKNKSEENFTFLITETTKILPAHRADKLKAGSFVTIIAPRDFNSEYPSALGIVIHPEKSESNGE